MAATRLGRKSDAVRSMTRTLTSLTDCVGMALVCRAHLALLCTALILLCQRGASAQSGTVDLDAPMPGDAERAFASTPDKPGFTSIWIPPFAFGTHLGGASVRLEPETREHDGIESASAVIWGFMATLWRFAHIDAGVGLATAEDREWTNDSEVTGYVGWLKLGPQLRLLLPVSGDAIDIALRASVGAEAWGLTRSSTAQPGCSDCGEQNIGLGGVYVSPEVDLAYAWGSAERSNAVGLKLAYERFVTGDLVDGLRLSLLVESYL